MNLKRASFPILLLILISGMFAKSHGGDGFATGIRAAHHHHASAIFSKHLKPCVALQSHQPGEPRRGEKRHGKSLVSQAIEAAYSPEVQLCFTYCQRDYSLFLPGGCCKMRIGPASLRGPPSQA